MIHSSVQFQLMSTELPLQMIDEFSWVFVQESPAD